MPGTRLRCELSWSTSRSKEFERCKRESWYARYASWNWWSERPRGERYRAMVHKNLTSLPAFAGDCVHRAIETWFRGRRSGVSMDAQELFEEARALFRSGWRQSAGDGWKARPNKSIHLDDHHYGVDVTRERTEIVRELLERCARHFVELEELRSARESDPADWLALEALDHFLFEGVKVYAVPDLAFRLGEEVHVLDWKTGKPRDEDRFQLEVYALFAGEKWGAAPESLRLRAVYLNPGEVRTVEVDAAILERARERVAESLGRMRAGHYDPDEEPADLSRWPADGAPQACRYCRFRGICPEAPGAGTT